MMIDFSVLSSFSNTGVVFESHHLPIISIYIVLNILSPVASCTLNCPSIE